MLMLAAVSGPRMTSYVQKNPQTVQKLVDAYVKTLK